MYTGKNSVFTATSKDVKESKLINWNWNLDTEPKPKITSHHSFHIQLRLNVSTFQRRHEIKIPRSSEKCRICKFLVQ